MTTRVLHAPTRHAAAPRLGRSAVSALGRTALLTLGLATGTCAVAQTPTLPETRVTATRLPDVSRSLPMGVTVLTGEEIRASGASTVNEALIRLLGIPGRADLFGGGEYALDLRGFGATADSNQVVVLDGQRLSEADTGGTRLSAIPVENIERIEVLRGSGAVLYGEGATGGVIVITTRAGAGTQAGNGASLYAGAGSYGLREVRGSATLAAQQLRLDASAQRRKADGFRANSGFTQEAASLGAQWVGEGLRVGGSIAEDDLDTRLPGALSRAQYEADPRQTSTPADWARLDGRRGTLFAEFDVGDWQLRADAGSRVRTLRSASGYEYDIDARTRSLSARHASTPGGLRNVLVLGHERGEWEREVLGAFGASATQETRAWFVRDDLTLASGTRLSAGWRTERLVKTDTGAPDDLRGRQQAWELGASHPITSDVTAYARAGRSFRLAKVDEFNFTTPAVALAPQTSRDLELGARWVRDAGSAELRVWRSVLENEIGYDPQAVGPSSPFGFNGANVNFDPTRRQGIELDLQQRVTRELGLRAHAALRRAEFREGPYAGATVPLVPERTMAVRADWRPAAGHTLSGGVNWVSSQYVDFANSCSVPSYTTADARYAFQWRQAEFSLGATNLFDRRFFTQAFACAGGQATSLYPEPGRAFTAAVRVAF
ncbi:TonB-dependent receptor [Ramlibacter sp. AN1015]|uniref:TonB-dependent receptor n=1 Tax=Ramlibacter sp. AN1015 TaxID=3133428 RepID=UPI0030BE2F95